MTSPEDEPETDRRRLLKYGLLATVGGLAGAGAILSMGDQDTDEDPESTPTDTDQPTPTTTPEDDLLQLIERFAPDLYYGRRERWFPTDPRPYTSDDDGRTVVDGFDALAGYTNDWNGSHTPPRPTVFYHVAPVDDRIVSLQYWMYSVFDQFTVNFHWHDWELLQVFVDTETGEAKLLVASAHARKCPNNEYLYPDSGSASRPVILSEVGSHSSTTDVNENLARFERFGGGGVNPDITNDGVRPIDRLTDQPFAYGLPRDEGFRLPFVLPELDGVALPDHPDLDGVNLGDFVDEDVTVRSWQDLAQPPGPLPTREPGLVLTPPSSQTVGDTTYELLPIDLVSEVIDDFTGPQLSFEFAIPGFVEELYADHITTVGIPWESPRFTDPVADITDPDHRNAIQPAPSDGLTDRVVGMASVLLGRSDGELDAVESDDRDAIAPFVSVSRFPLPVEVACLLQSDPAAVPTAGGVYRFLHVEPGMHDLIVNGPGLAPYAERFEHTGGTTRPGVNGQVTMVPNEDAVILRGDRRDTTGVQRVRVTETFVGPVYDGQPIETDRFAVPVHSDGEYTVEVIDNNGVQGAVRVNPRELESEPIPSFETGKVALAMTLAKRLAEAADQAREFAADREAQEASIPREFELASRDASTAAELAAEGEAAAANERLVLVVDRLIRIRELLRDPEDYGYTATEASLLRHLGSTNIDLAETAYRTPISNS